MIAVWPSEDAETICEVFPFVIMIAFGLHTDCRIEGDELLTPIVGFTRKFPVLLVNVTWDEAFLSDLHSIATEFTAGLSLYSCATGWLSGCSSSSSS